MDSENPTVMNDTNGDDHTMLKSDWNGKNHVFILSSAGKPVYSRYGSEDKLVTLFGVMQALVSFVQDSDDSIEAIYFGNNVLVFVIKGPIILVAVSSKNESVKLLVNQLLYVYNQVVSVLTLTRVTRIFEQRHNYDLRRLLTGSERLIDHLLNFTESQPEFLLDGISCLPLNPVVRDSISNVIVSTCSKIKNLVFAILIAGNKLITLIHMKKYIIKPSDLHLIINMVSASESFKAAESWTPICLPNFDSSGYLHGHVSYLTEDCQACLLLLTVDTDLFFELSEAKRKITEKLKKNHSITSINKAVDSPVLSMNSINVSQVRHFLYKCKKNSHIMAPPIIAPYSTSETAQKLFHQYQILHSTIHSNISKLKLFSQQFLTEFMLGWVTEKFELYVTLEPIISKSASIDAVDKLLKWIQKEEDKFFIANFATF